LSEEVMHKMICKLATRSEEETSIAGAKRGQKTAERQKEKNICGNRGKGSKCWDRWSLYTFSTLKGINEEHV